MATKNIKGEYNFPTGNQLAAIFIDSLVFYGANYTAANLGLKRVDPKMGDVVAYAVLDTAVRSDMLPKMKFLEGKPVHRMTESVLYKSIGLSLFDSVMKGRISIINPVLKIMIGEGANAVVDMLLVEGKYQ